MVSFGFSIDWISATFADHDAYKFARMLGYETWAKSVPATPPRGYNRCVELETGARIAWSESRTDMGTHIVLSGSTLSAYRDKNLDGLQLLKIIRENNGRTSRVDLAIDVKNGGLKLTDFSRDTRILMKSRGRQPKLWPTGTQEDGWTVYVGNRESDKFFRIYDKAKERGNFEDDYVRFELECKGEIGHAVGWEFALFDVQAAYGMASRLILDFVDFNVEVWRQALSSATIEKLEVPKNDKRDTLGWLIKSCVPALAKEIAKHPNDGILDAFVNELELKLREYNIELTR